MEIVTYQPQYKKDFERLNTEWIAKHFIVEVADKKLFGLVEEKIIIPGGDIFFARMDNNIVGTVAMLPKAGGIFELSKMAVTEAYQAKGIGKALIEHALTWAKTKQVPAVMLETNTKLQPAIKLYKRMGFIEVSLPKIPTYNRVDYRMIYPLAYTCQQAIKILDKVALCQV